MRSEDGYIIQQCLDGDAAAFGFLVEKYRKPVYALAYSRIGDFHDAQDITQEVFVNAYRKLRSLKRWDSFMGWLYRITDNQCKMLIRARSRRPDREFAEDQIPGTIDHPSVDSYREDMVYESVREALDSLPEMYRQVVTLRYFGGMTVKEISRFLGVSPNTIDRRLRAARVRLKEEMPAMMNTAYEQHQLPANFTFRIVEAVKRIRIHSMPRATGLPWGLSLAAGIIIAVIGLGSHTNISNLMAVPAGSSLPSKAKVLKTGEIPVDILKTSHVSAMASKQGNNDGEKPQNSLLPAPQQDGGGTWTEKADMPTARVDLSTSVVDGTIYAIGGLAARGVFLPTVEAYDPVTDTWTKKADMPTPRAGHSASVVDGVIYAIGGGWPFLSTVEAYDPAIDTWTKKADMPTKRDWFSTSVVDGVIYAIGGWDDPWVLSTVEAYDPATDTWTKKADMPTPRFCLSTSVVNGEIYAFGGEDLATAFATVEAYDPATDTWTRKTDMPTGKFMFSISAVNGKIYAIGGGGGDALLSAVEEYDPVTDTWTKKPDMPTARLLLSTSAVNGKIYAIGGGPDWDAALAEGVVEEYDPRFAAIEPRGKLPTTWGAVKSD
ncbi:sigma-70 family RNA polymerase sigma factor [Candidatus Poribacteria bacterium]